MDMKRFLMLGAALAAFAGPCGAFAAAQDDQPVVLDNVDVRGSKDLDSIAYADEYKVIRKAAALTGLDKVELRFFLRSKRKDIDLKDVRLHLTGSTVDQDVPVAPDGFFTLPILPAAAEEKALVVSNMPSGSLQLFYGPEILGGGTRAVHYRDLMDGMAQSTKMMKALWGFFFPSFVGVSVRFDQPDAFLTFGSPAAPHRIAAENGDTFIILDYDEGLYKENPEISFSTPPSRIVPVNVRPRKSTNAYN